MSRFITSLAGCALSTLVLSAPAAEPGSWQQHDIQFRYMGFTSIYSCDGLADRMKELLVLAGARADATSRASGCTEMTGPDLMAGARLRFSTVAGDPKAEAPSGTVWRKVRFANGTPRDLQSGECELVEQFRDEVLKKAFTTRNLKSRTSCFPHQANQRFDIEFEVLVPAR